MAGKKPLVVSLVGARPQFIKTAPLADKLSRRFRHIIVHSGQHYDRLMSDIFFKELAIPKAKYNLSVGSGFHGEMTAGIIKRFEKLLLKLMPDVVLVYGDTDSTLAGALAAAKLNIPVGHVEAGLRSFRRDMPEEINRRLTDHISQVLFCPTAQSIKNLKAEGIKKGIIRSGDLMYELLGSHKKRIRGNRKIIDRFGLVAGQYMLMTMHRAGNVDDGDNLEKIVGIILGINMPVVFPVHPRTLKNLRKFRLLGRLQGHARAILVEPLSYLDNLSLMYYARATLTDSGGMQKESVFLGTPCLTLRDETEWTETLEWGNYLVGLSLQKIRRRLKNLKRRAREVPVKVGGKNPSIIITSALADYLGE
jgi:UDP-N-acetylglucosamine 2-epimerase